MIKKNESDVENTVYEIMAKTVFKFFCFILFLALTILHNYVVRYPNFNKFGKKLEIEIF